MTLPHDTQQAELLQAMKELKSAQERVLALRRSVKPLPVQDYQLTAPDGRTVSLYSLFGDKDELMIIHNMGRGCRFCTLWADGFNGVVPHVENRVSFAVVTPDKPEIVKEFSEGRGWKFRILTARGTTFSKDMGFEKNGQPQPGVSTFRRNPDGSVVRTASDDFGPGDHYSSIWHLFDLLPKGVNNWEPQYKY